MLEIIGIDVGATKTAAARVDVTTGTVVGPQRVWATKPQRGGAAVLADCIQAIDHLEGSAEIPVGIAICEVVDREGRIQSAKPSIGRT